MGTLVDLSQTAMAGC